MAMAPVDDAAGGLDAEALRPYPHQASVVEVVGHEPFREQADEVRGGQHLLHDR